MITLTLYQVGMEINIIHGSELNSFSIMALIICTLLYIKHIIIINIINELLRYIFFEKFTYNRRMDIGLNLPKSLESRHGLFIIEHIKDDFKNFGI